MKQEWLLFVYKLPPEPAAGRVGIWRKLKGFGGVYVQGGACLLPKSDNYAIRLRSLEKDVSSLGGEAILFGAIAFDAAETAKVVARFQADRDDQYRELIAKCSDFEEEIAKEFRKEKFTYAELQEEEAEFRKLRTWLGKIRRIDFFQASLSEEAERYLLRCEEALTRYSSRVFLEQGEGQ